MANYPTIPASFEVSFEMLASKNKRFANRIIDEIIITILLVIVVMVLLFIANVFELYGLIIWMQQIPTIQAYIIGALFSTAYYFLFEIAGSRTFGKLLTGTKVVMAETGARPTVGAILKRSLARLIPFEAFSFLGEWSVGWHDRLSGTSVVDVKKYEEELYLKLAFDELGKQQEVA